MPFPRLPLFSRSLRHSTTSATPPAASDPLLDVAWAHAYQADGPEMVALGYSDTDAVSSWPDEAGSDDLAQATGTDQPAYKATAGPNSQPAVQGDGVNDYLDKAFSATVTQPMSVVVVSAISGAKPYTTLFGQEDTSNAAVYQDNNTQNVFAAATTVVDTGLDFVDNQQYLWVAYFDGASSEVTQDGVSGGTINAGTGSLNGLTIGSNHDQGASSWNSAPYSFIGVFDGDVTTDPGWAAFLAEVETKYGIDATPAATPLLDVGWAHAYQADGPEMVALAYSDTDAVSSWPDEIGTEDLAQATGTDQPAYSATGGAGSQPGVVFDGTDDTILSGVYSAQAQPYTRVIIATSPDGTSNTDALLGSSLAAQSVLYWNLNDEVVKIGAGTNKSTTFDMTGDTDPHLYVAYFDAVPAFVEVDGVRDSAILNIGTDSVTRFAIAAANDGAASFGDFTVMFAAEFDGDVTTDPNWNAFLGEVESKYGIECGYVNPDTPLLNVSWEHAYQADGPAMTALAYSDTDAVSSWPDETLNGGADLAQATGTLQPAYAATGGPNSQPAVDPDGTDDFLKVLFGSTYTHPITVVAVGATSSTDRFFSGYDSSHQMGLIDDNSPDVWHLLAGNYVATSLTNDSSNHLFVAHFNGASSTLTVDGVTSDVVDAGPDDSTGLTVFASYAASQHSANPASFFAVFDGDVTTDPNWFAFLDEVYSKYGIDARPPSLMGFDHLYWTEGAEFEALALSDTDAVSSWPDEVGTADLAQATGTAQPLYSATGGPNSQPTVVADGTDDLMSTASGNVIGRPGSVVAIFKADDADTTERRLFSKFTAPDPTFSILAGNFGWDVTARQDIGTDDSNPHLFVGYIGATFDSHWGELDGVRTSLGGGAAVDLSFGELFGASKFWDGNCAFIGMTDGDVTSDPNWTQFENYIAWKYGLTIA